MPGALNSPTPPYASSQSISQTTSPNTGHIFPCTWFTVTLHIWYRPRFRCLWIQTGQKSRSCTALWDLHL